ncbi:hypothetical protein [Cylindrospermum sp. FACHB-282]|uniref:hypothetical protein n=1 Tax=Cylindrospermum sp. FACHB-282 TaxID=2692794 RepID=UPI001685D8D0|nr:hypothetical protein [Cylindrospermum sp. FACHB-282]MBD2388184.1 hypothetical protein [Cylindrospermum sp. FACHB-282]
MLDNFGDRKQRAECPSNFSPENPIKMRSHCEIIKSSRNHWENEIRAFDKGIQQALKRLGN